MKFSLKTWLFGMCIIGAVVGVMARLFLESPEKFLAVVHVGSALGPFLLAVGTIIWLGVRGAPRGRGLVIWGVVLLLTPVFTQVVLALLMPAGNPIQVLSTDRLITKRLPAQIEEPWVWNELQRRLVGMDLTAEDVNEAVLQLASHMRQTKPNGWDQPLAWQREFLKSARLKGMISDKAFLELCEAYYGSPKIEVQPPNLTTDDTSFNVNIKHGSAWSEQTGLNVELLWDTQRLLIDGAEFDTRTLRRFGNEHTAVVETNLTPGEHTLTVEIEAAIVDERLLPLAIKQLPVSQWPKARKRWTSVYSVPLKVEASTN